MDVRSIKPMDVLDLTISQEIRGRPVVVGDRLLVNRCRRVARRCRGMDAGWRLRTRGEPEPGAPALTSTDDFEAASGIEPL
jgi:hypothetical protein